MPDVKWIDKPEDNEVRGDIHFCLPKFKKKEWQCCTEYENYQKTAENRRSIRFTEIFLKLPKKVILDQRKKNKKQTFN